MALTTEITAEEIKSSISKLKANKAPGTDGYTPQWSKLLREPLIPLLRNTFNWLIKEGEIPNSWREAFISCYSKRRKDKVFLSKAIDNSLLF